MGIILLLVCLGYIIVAAIIFLIAKKLIKSKWIVILVALVLILFPFRRLIFYEALFYVYNRAPLQAIHETVDNPISVYWEDNVWPGFDEYGRNWMVKNYLDGIHLKVLALNGDDGKIFLYRASAEDFTEAPSLSEQIVKLETKKTVLRKEFLTIYNQDFLAANKPIRSPEDEEKRRNYIDNHPLHQKIEKLDQQIGSLKERLHNIKEHGLKNIMARIEVYDDKTTLPTMRYRVEFNPLPKSLVINNDYNMLHADRISIIDTQTDKEIAFSQRYMAYAGLLSKFSGQQPKFDFKLGDIHAYEFDDKVLFGYNKVRSNLDVLRNELERNNFNRISFKRFKTMGAAK